MSVVEAVLDEGVGRLGLALEGTQRERLLAFLALLAKWNRAYNLTAVRAPGEMVVRHLLDSLSLLPHLSGGRVLDVGSGGGLPGIPLAIAAPQRCFTLLDSNSKKTRFLIQAAAELGLENLSVVHSRVESYRPPHLFDTITARAYATLAELLESAGHLLAAGGRVLAMKGAYPAEELAAVPPPFRVVEVVRLEVPGLEAERHLVALAAASTEK